MGVLDSSGTCKLHAPRSSFINVDRLSMEYGVEFGFWACGARVLFLLESRRRKQSTLLVVEDMACGVSDFVFAVSSFGLVVRDVIQPKPEAIPLYGSLASTPEQQPRMPSY